MEVRGEAFGSLLSNKNDISETLIRSLSDGEKNVRAHVALVLGNRKDQDAVGPLIRLAGDERSAVRSCALGALGHLKAGEAKKVIHDCFTDDSMEVKRSALRASIDIGDRVSADELRMLSNENDDELGRLVLVAANKKDGGPEGI